MVDNLLRLGIQASWSTQSKDSLLFKCNKAYIITLSSQLKRGKYTDISAAHMELIMVHGTDLSG